METQNRPEMKFRVGAVCASVWRRTSTRRTGERYETRQVTLDRSYKDLRGDWKSTTSLDVNDIPKAILALQRAYPYMLERPESPRAEPPAGRESFVEERVDSAPAAPYYQPTGSFPSP